MTEGIDISAFQKEIDFDKVKASGIDFAIIRAGWGKGNGNGNIDPYFKKYMDGAMRVGLNIGAYWFIYALSEADVVINARAFSNAMAPYRDKVTMKLWCDFEYDTDSYANKNGLVFTKEMRTKWIELFCETLIADGWDVGVYANPDYLKNKLGDLSKYPLWLACYGSSKGSYNACMWQYSSKGSVSGISGAVDLNHCYMDVIPSEPVKPHEVALPTLRIGEKGTEVKLMQDNLNVFGYHLAADGDFGQRTYDALKGWQLATGLDSDGIWGQASYSKMCELLKTT